MNFEIEQIISKYIKVLLLKDIQIDRIIIYGSYASGKAHKDSDIDLAILGDDPEKYDIYEENIRKEYSFVPLDVYQSARASILSDFLSRENIYHTSLIKPREEMARDNLKRAIENLS